MMKFMLSNELSKLVRLVQFSQAITIREVSMVGTLIKLLIKTVQRFLPNHQLELFLQFEPSIRRSIFRYVIEHINNEIISSD